MDVAVATVAEPHGDSRVAAVVAEDAAAVWEAQRQWRMCHSPRQNTWDARGSVQRQCRMEMRHAAAAVAAVAAVAAGEGAARP